MNVGKCSLIFYMRYGSISVHDVKCKVLLNCILNIRTDNTEKHAHHPQSKNKVPVKSVNATPKEMGIQSLDEYARVLTENMDNALVEAVDAVVTAAKTLMEPVETTEEKNIVLKITRDRLNYC